METSKISQSKVVSYKRCVLILTLQALYVLAKGGHNQNVPQQGLVNTGGVLCFHKQKLERSLYIDMEGSPTCNVKSKKFSTDQSILNATFCIY